MADISQIARNRLSRHGVCAPQEPEAWGGAIELPAAIAAFYSNVGPVNINIEGYGNPTTLPSLENLWERQSGYRWNGLTGDPIEDWPSNWIVIANEGGDPYIFDSETEKILFAMHGAGNWAADEMFADIPTMAACIATLGCVMLDADEFEDEDGDVNPDCIKKAIDQLAEILGDRDDAESLVEQAGWE